MKLFIPACGDRLTLTSSWRFPLWLEHRNLQFAYFQGFLSKEESRSWRGIFEDQKESSLKFKRVGIILPAGSILECDRVYIRTQNKQKIHADNDYDSITWKLIDPKKDKSVRGGRFWVKLSDCNEIHYELSENSLYRDRVKAVKLIMES